MNKIELIKLQLKTFTQQDVSDYCILNNIINISVLKNLIKLKKLFISLNNIKNISVIQYLKNLELLDIEILELKSDQIVQYINKCKKLKELRYDSEYNMDISEQLNKNIIIK